MGPCLPGGARRTPLAGPTNGGLVALQQPGPVDRLAQREDEVVLAWVRACTLLRVERRGQGVGQRHGARRPT